MVMAIANLAMATGNVGREGVGVNPLRGQNNVQGSCDMGSFPHELPGYRHVSDSTVRAPVRIGLGRGAAEKSRGCASRTCSTRRSTAASWASTCQGEDIAQSDPDTQHVPRARGDGVHRRAGPVPQRDREVRPRVPAGSHPSSRRTAPSPTPSAAFRASRKVMPPKAKYADWEVTMLLSNALGYPMNYKHPSRDHGGDRGADADLLGRELRADRQARQRPVAVQCRGARTARRRCTWTPSCAARASSSSRSTSRATRRSRASIR